MKHTLFASHFIFGFKEPLHSALTLPLGTGEQPKNKQLL